MKIAVITHNPHYNIGGIETTVRIKFGFWHKDNEITEYPTFLIQEDIKQVSEPIKSVKVKYDLLGWKPYNILWGGTYTNKKMKRIFEYNDVVIFDTLVPSRKWIKHPKAVLVQHEYQKFYSTWGKGFGISLGTIFSSFLFGAGSIRNPFYKASNSVFFTEYDSINVKGSKYIIPLPAMKKKDISSFKVSSKRKGFIWVARIDDRIKNLRELSSISNEVEGVDIFGDGRDNGKLLKWLDNESNMKGFLEHKKIFDEMNKHKAMIMTSKFEGFPNTVVESLSVGLPVILFNTFESAQFFEESGAVFLIDDGDTKAFVEKMEWLDNLSTTEYNKITKKAKDFAIKFLTIEAYKKRWNDLINNIKDGK